ncbi:MAG: DUF61 family protein [Candidatus Methanomethylicia archaeon]
MFRHNDSFDRVIHYIYKSDIERLNAHLPRNFKSLNELVCGVDTTIKAIDGSDIIIDREELNLLCRIIPKDFHDKLKLPLVFLRRIDLGRGIYELLGDKIEAFTVLKFLGTNTPISDIKLPLRIYRPQLFKLKTLLPTSVTIAFSSIEESNI